jgi:hypothetical protein
VRGVGDGWMDGWMDGCLTNSFFLMKSVQFGSGSWLVGRGTWFGSFLEITYPRSLSILRQTCFETRAGLFLSLGSLLLSGAVSI